LILEEKTKNEKLFVPIFLIEIYGQKILKYSYCYVLGKCTKFPSDGRHKMKKNFMKEINLFFSMMEKKYSRNKNLK
jgi:hypothetical protein